MDEKPFIRANWMAEKGRARGTRLVVAEKEGKGGEERTELADGGRAPEDERGFAGVRRCAALVPWSGELSGVVAFAVGPETGDSGREGERDGRRLVERNVGRELGPSEFVSQ